MSIDRLKTDRSDDDRNDKNDVKANKTPNDGYISQYYIILYWTQDSRGRVGVWFVIRRVRLVRVCCRVGFHKTYECICYYIVTVRSRRHGLLAEVSPYLHIARVYRDISYMLTCLDVSTAMAIIAYVAVNINDNLRLLLGI